MGGLFADELAIILAMSTFRRLLLAFVVVVVVVVVSLLLLLFRFNMTD